MELLSKKGRRKRARIRADIEHMRKLFIIPDSPDKFLNFGNDLLILIQNLFKEKGGIHSEISLPNLSKIFSDHLIPQGPQLLKDTITEIKEKVIAHSVKVGSPYYIGHMTSTIPYFMILLEMIIAALNQNQVKIETAKASTFLERELIAWIHKLIYNRSSKFYNKNIQNHRVALGNVSIDGTIANLTALLVARNKAFPPDNQFPGIQKAGIVEAYKYYNCKKAVMLVSRRGHYSIDKIARMIGVGDENVIKIPVDTRNKVNIHQLRKVCNDIREENKNSKEQIKIISLIGIAGTTETGNIDNLAELRKIADENKTFFHVDAAWGGAVLLVEKYRNLFKGIESADSVTFDAHKLLFSPLSMGMILFRDETELNNIKHSSNYIIRPDSVDQGRFTIEGSRPFTALKPWATFKIFGAEGFKLLFENAFQLTSVFRGLIDQHCDFELMNKPELFIINYRYVPKKVQERLEQLLLETGECKPDEKENIRAEIESINTKLNELNRELHRAIRKQDTSFVSRTALESTRYTPQNIVVLRAITINPLTTLKILQEIVDEHNRLGHNIYKSDFENQFRKI